MADQEDLNTHILQELETLSRSLSRAHASRRTASLVLPRYSNADDGPRLVDEAARSDHRSRSSRHVPLSPWHFPRNLEGDDADVGGRHHALGTSRQKLEEKRGIWSWKPMRALAHLAMHRLVCLFSVEVVAIQHVPSSINGLRLSVAVRKKETKDGSVQTMPSRVLQGFADFEETLFIRCHLYCSGGASAGKPLKFEPRPFLISVVAVDAPQLDFGASVVDLSSLVKESILKNLEGQRLRQWDTACPLSGKAEGGEMVLKLGFQIMEDGGVGIYNHPEARRRPSKEKDSSFSLSKKQSKSSLRVASSRKMRGDPSATSLYMRDLEETKDFGLDGPTTKWDHKEEDPGLPEFEVIDKGIEIQGERREEEEEVISEDATEGTLVSSEVVKEMVNDRAQSRLKELRLIAREIKSLDLMLMEDDIDLIKTTQKHKVQRIDADEEMVTREFLQMLELEDSKGPKYGDMELVTSSNPGAEGDARDEEEHVLVPDLGKSLGCVVQTRDGGYLVAMNPLEAEVTRKETPKLAMQISRELIIEDEKLASGFEVLQRLAAMGSEEMGSKLLSLTAMDDLIGKTAEQVAFEGIASAIISGRNKEGASSSAARSITMVKKMAAAMNEGRKEKILTGIWSVKDEPVTADEILTFSLQKIEAMAVEALKVQAEMSEEEAPFDVSPLIEKDESSSPLDSAISPEDVLKTCSVKSKVTMLVVIQLRDPVRSYEAVGAPVIAMVQAVGLDDGQVDNERSFKLMSVHVGGLKLSTNSKRSAWDGDKQRLTAMQWLVENGLSKARRRTKQMQARRGQDLVWSISSRFMAGTWLRPVRNPDVKVLSNIESRCDFG